MLTPKELKLLPGDMLNHFQDLEDKIIADIAKKLKDDLILAETSGYQLSVLQSMGYDLQEVKREIAEASNVSMRKLDSLMKDSSYLAYDNDVRAYRVGKKVLPPLVKNPVIVKFINATIKQTRGELKNYTDTMGFMDNGTFKDITKFYRDTLNNAVIQVGSGAYSYNDALRQAVKKLGDSGLRTVNYKSGRVYNTESAVRMTVMTGISQITGYMSEANADMMGQDLMETTAHSNARPDHSEWQGQIVSRNGNSKYLSMEDIGYETVEGFKGTNCRHDWFPFFEGISEPAYTKESLKQLDTEPFEYNGKTYSGYDATQYQRSIERRIRATKRQLMAYDNAGLKDEFTSASIKLRRQKNLYKDFSNASGIRMKNDRHQVYNFGRSIAGKAR